MTASELISFLILSLALAALIYRLGHPRAARTSSASPSPQLRPGKGKRRPF